MLHLPLPISRYINDDGDGDDDDNDSDDDNNNTDDGGDQDTSEDGDNKGEDVSDSGDNHYRPIFLGSLLILCGNNLNLIFNLLIPFLITTNR